MKVYKAINQKGEKEVNRSSINARAELQEAAKLVEIAQRDASEYSLKRLEKAAFLLG